MRSEISQALLEFSGCSPISEMAPEENWQLLNSLFQEGGKGGVLGAQEIQKPERGSQEFLINLPFGESKEKPRGIERHYR